MTDSLRDERILKHMLNWCIQNTDAHQQYSRSREAFDQISTYRNAVSMCLFQICELAGHLSDDFRSSHPELPWQQINGMRNLLAHDYGNMNTESIWETSCNDIPGIEAFCRAHISSGGRE